MALNESLREQYRPVLMEILKHPFGQFYFSDKFAPEEPGIDLLLGVLQESYPQAELPSELLERLEKAGLPGEMYVSGEITDGRLTIPEIEYIDQLIRMLDTPEKGGLFVDHLKRIGNRSKQDAEPFLWRFCIMLCQVEFKGRAIPGAQTDWKKLKKEALSYLSHQQSTLLKESKRFLAALEKKSIHDNIRNRIKLAIDSDINMLRNRWDSIENRRLEIAEDHVFYDPNRKLVLTSGNPTVNGLLLEMEFMLTRCTYLSAREICEKISFLLNHLEIKDGKMSFEGESIRSKNNRLKKKLGIEPS